MQWTLRRSTAADASWIADLRAEVMRPDLERLERFDPHWVRQRFLNAFEPENTSVIVVDGRDVGSVAVRDAQDAVWIEHFYIDSRVQGRGLGGEVLRCVLEKVGEDRALRLNVLQGSAARRLYERQGFVLESEDPVDVFMIRRPVRV